MKGQGEQAAEVLEFWFVQSRPRQWFAKDPAFDALLRERFLGLTRRATAGAAKAEPLRKQGPRPGQGWLTFRCRKWRSFRCRLTATPPWRSRAIPRLWR